MRTRVRRKIDVDLGPTSTPEAANCSGLRLSRLRQILDASAQLFSGQISLIGDVVSGKRFLTQFNDFDESYVFAWLTDRAFESDWSRPNVPLLVFADSSLPGTSVIPHGGPVASGVPVQLLFWGSWWTTPEGGQRLWLIEDRLKAVLASNYFSELDQYGVSPPQFRGSLIVKKPSPPTSFPDLKAEHSPGDMIVDLIEDDVMPDPDDEQIAYIVLMPKGFTTSGTNGAHTRDYDYEFPFDRDWFWWAWVRYFADNEVDDTTRTLTHELTELLTDPNSGDGWFADPASDGEIAGPRRMWVAPIKQPGSTVPRSRRTGQIVTAPQ